MKHIKSYSQNSSLYLFFNFSFKEQGNSSTTLLKFYMPEADKVSRLNFYDSSTIGNNLYNLKITNDLEQSTEQSKNIVKFKSSMLSLLF